MDAFLRNVLEQREREHGARIVAAPPIALPLLPEDRKPGPRLRAEPRPDPVLELFRFHEEVSSELVAERCDLSMDTANQRLSRLFRRGVIERARFGVYRRARRAS
jgi:hypothetical protein